MKWHIRKLLHKNKIPKEKDVSPLEETCPPLCSEEPQSGQQLRWECFENNLAQRMGKSKAKKIVLKSLAPNDNPIWSGALMDKQSKESDSSRGDKVVGDSVLMRTTDENGNIPRTGSTSSSVPMEESGPTKIYSKRDPAKATMTKKPSESDTVSLKSRATTTTASSETTPSRNDFSSVTDSIAYTGTYTRATLESLVDDKPTTGTLPTPMITVERYDSPSLGTDSIAYTGSYTRTTMETLVDDESTIATLPTPLIAIERVLMIMSSLFLCGPAQDESTSCRWSVKHRADKRVVKSVVNRN